MNTNNAILFTFLLIIIGQAFVIPLVAESFNVNSQEYDTEQLAQDMFQTDISDTVNFTFVKFVLSVLFWNPDAPSWLNILIFVPMRIIIAVILYDKFRGI